MLMMFFYGFKKEILLCFAAGLFTTNIQDQFAIMSNILVYRLQPRDRSLASYWQVHTAGLDTIFVQIYMDALPGVPGVSKNQIFFFTNKTVEFLR
jgi:hypothetical protein